ncbi:response regulator transcription factor [Treponema sp.]|uniref:response regulator transcription factor n=1 Tax=Treponema sp. TaxID=166 RepID=UPI003F0AA6E0
MKTKILVVEDVPEMAELICMYLEKAEFEPLALDTAEKALEKLDEGYDPALIILDLNLPGMSGFDFLKTFRKNYKASVPVIIVSARDADEDIIAGLGFGADEFVTKPFSPKVLVARVQAKLSRLCATQASVEETIQFGPYTVFCNSCILKKGTEKIPLSTKEYAVLEYLVKNSSQPASPEQIFSAVWKNQFGDMTAVGVYVQRLRKKIEDNPANPKYIKTVFGMGYQLCMDSV